MLVFDIKIIEDEDGGEEKPQARPIADTRPPIVDHRRRRPRYYRDQFRKQFRDYF
jgi:hypothetical protein